MFEKIFGGSKTEEQKEQDLYILASKEFEFLGVNLISIHNAFKTIKEINISKKYGFTNNYLLNLVKNSAKDNVSPMEDVTMGGREEVLKNIDMEIDKMRKDLSEEEQKS